MSLKRLLDSLLANDYKGDVIPLEFYIDAPANEQAQDDALLSEHAKVIELCNSFEWPHGPKKVILREQVCVSCVVAARLLDADAEDGACTLSPLPLLPSCSTLAW